VSLLIRSVLRAQLVRSLLLLLDVGVGVCVGVFGVVVVVGCERGRMSFGKRCTVPNNADGGANVVGSSADDEVLLLLRGTSTTYLPLLFRIHRRHHLGVLVCIITTRTTNGGGHARGGKLHHGDFQFQVLLQAVEVGHSRVATEDARGHRQTTMLLLMTNSLVVTGAGTAKLIEFHLRVMMMSRRSLWISLRMGNRRRAGRQRNSHVAEG